MLSFRNTLVIPDVLVAIMVLMLVEACRFVSRRVSNVSSSQHIGNQMRFSKPTYARLSSKLLLLELEPKRMGG